MQVPILVFTAVSVFKAIILEFRNNAIKLDLFVIIDKNFKRLHCCLAFFVLWNITNYVVLLY